MRKVEPLKVLGILATVVGVAASTLSSYVEDKKMDAKIEAKVHQALAESDETKEE